MERKKYLFLVEVIYEQPYSTPPEGDEDIRFKSALARQVYTFTDDVRDRALHSAKAEMDRILRYGLKMANAGAMVQMTISPSSIKQVGVVDHNKWLDEREAEIAAYQEANPADTVSEPETDNTTDASDGYASSLPGQSDSVSQIHTDTHEPKYADGIPT